MEALTPTLEGPGRVVDSAPTSWRFWFSSAKRGLAHHIEYSRVSLHVLFLLGPMTALDLKTCSLTIVKGPERLGNG